jgi:hypothetical protein
MSEPLRLPFDRGATGKIQDEARASVEPEFSHSFSRGISDGKSLDFNHGVRGVKPTHAKFSRLLRLAAVRVQILFQDR